MNALSSLPRPTPPVVTPAPQRAREDAPKMARSLGLLDAISMLVGIILGSGIFVAPAEVAGFAGSMPAAVGLWAAGATVAGFGALCYAECGARLPQDGGFFVFFDRAFGWRWAFVAGWAALLISYPTSLAGVAVLSGRYLGAAWPGADRYAHVWAIGCLSLAAAVNALGVQEGRLAQRLMTGGKVVVLLSVLGAALWAVAGLGPPTDVTAPVGMALESAAKAAVPLAGVALWLQALATMMWSYDGWTDITMVAGEVRDPQKNLARAVLLSLGLLFVLYATVQVAVMALLGAQAAGSPQVLALALSRAFGARGAQVLGVLVLLTTVGSVNGVLFATSRLAYAMARRGAILPYFAKLAGSENTPRRAIVGVWAVSCVYVLWGSFAELVEMFALVIWLFYGATALALLGLRRAGVGGDVHGPGFNHWLPPTVLLCACAAMTGLQVAESPWRSGAVLLLLVSARLLLGRIRRRFDTRGATPHGV